HDATKAEAEEIKRLLSQFLQDELKLELNQEKTLITHARSQRARFLGYEIATQHTDRFLTNGRRSANGVIGLKVPKAVIKAKCARHMHHGKPVRHRELTNFDDHAIIASYGAEYRGIVQYYLFAGDVARDPGGPAGAPDRRRLVPASGDGATHTRRAWGADQRPDIGYGPVRT